MTGNKTRSRTSADTSNYNYSFQDIDGIAVAGENNSITVLDGGAIEDSFEFADDIAKRSFGLAQDALNLTKHNNIQVLEYGSEVTDKALNYTQDIIKTNNEKRDDKFFSLVTYAGVGILVYVGIKNVRR